MTSEGTDKGSDRMLELQAPRAIVPGGGLSFGGKRIAESGELFGESRLVINRRRGEEYCLGTPRSGKLILKK